MKNFAIAIVLVVVASVAAFFGYRYFAAESAEVVTNPIEVGPVLAESASAPASVPASAAQ